MGCSEIVIDNNNVCSSKIAIQKANDLLLPPNVKLLSIFDGENHDDSFNDMYSKLGFFKNLKVDGPIAFSPKKIQAYIDSYLPEQLIWISKKTGDTHPIHFIWVYSHELQHLRDSVLDYELHILGCFVYRFLSFVNLNANAFDVPTEVECERVGERTARKIFGDESVDRYLSSLQGQELDIRKKFLEKNSIFSSDIKSELIKIICENRDVFEKLQDTRTNKAKEPRINFDYYCK